MKNNNDCKIVQDLLPNYIDKLTNEETNIFIEEHFKTCPSCKEIYENMKQNIELSDTYIPKKEVQYIKKYSNKLKLLKIILMLIILIFVIITSIKFVILSNVQSKSEKYVADITEDNITYSTYVSENFHRTTYLYSKNNYTKLDAYKLGNKTLITLVTLQDNVYTVTKIYKNGDTINMYKESEER